MSQLLISVKNVEEAVLASYAGVDLIDLKDPTVGALGALDAEVVHQVVETLDDDAFISATVGEGHTTLESLLADVTRYAALGVDVIKIAVSDLFCHDFFVDEVQKLTAKGLRLVAVFFADEALKLDLIAILKQSGFYGAMLDTKQKKAALLSVCDQAQVEAFLNVCEQHKLMTGLAGSVNIAHMYRLLALSPKFIGMRGGVCDGYNRTASLSNTKISAVKDMLLKYNKK